MLKTIKVYDNVFGLFVTGVCLSQNVVLQVAFFSFKTVSTTESETTEATTLTTEAQTSPTEPSGKSTLGFQTDSIRFNLNTTSKLTRV